MNELIIRRGESKTISGLAPSAACPKGTPVYISDKDADSGINTFALAAGRCDGFLTREVRETVGLTDEEQLMGFGLETPFTVSKNASIEKASELEIEGPATSAAEYLVGSGTGAIAANTAAGTILSFAGGKFRVAQQNDFGQFRLVKQMTPKDVGAVRIYVQEVEGYKVP